MKLDDWFTVEYVHPRIVSIAEFHHFEKVVSYLVLGDRRAILVDTGMGYASMSAVVRRITRAPISVLLTHTHWDHIGGVGEFSDVSVFDHPFEVGLLRDGFLSKQIAELMDKSLFEDSWKPLAYAVPGVESFSTFHDGETIVCEPFSLTVKHTPGHTPGSVCFIVNEIDILISGDTLYPGPLYAQLPESNINDYAQSIQTLVQPGNKIHKILPGHNATSAGVELLQDADMVFQKILAKSVELGKRGKSEYSVNGENMSVLLSEMPFEAIEY